MAISEGRTQFDHLTDMDPRSSERLRWTALSRRSFMVTDVRVAQRVD